MSPLSDFHCKKGRVEVKQDADNNTMRARYLHRSLRVFRFLDKKNPSQGCLRWYLESPINLDKDSSTRRFRRDSSVPFDNSPSIDNKKLTNTSAIFPF